MKASKMVLHSPQNSLQRCKHYITVRIRLLCEGHYNRRLLTRKILDLVRYLKYTQRLHT